jgi:hypothetical protein
MRKPEDMTPKKIKKPDVGYIGGAVPFETKQEPTIPAYITTKSIISAKAIRIAKEEQKKQEEIERKQKEKEAKLLKKTAKKKVK